ncbi:uncharacterized protein B0P05DRAFT_543583 [Gilbertella persicaria]|uniref:uncharacterized protein n=1 Tax=Gilbertella persicaria TaxID=101096 RepID=UPI0022203CB1|nr:uncharacterized protein B0P05DRAFT_543583 [Gilbertella persicaria]KAI8077973.1 hypothetical protein B0P05DRAFT_543583 [Gilbertella persicaria]
MKENKLDFYKSIFQLHPLWRYLTAALNIPFDLYAINNYNTLNIYALNSYMIYMSSEQPK